MLGVLGFTIVVAVVVLPLGNRWGRAVFPLAALAPAAGFLFLLAHASGIVDGDAYTQTFQWIPELHLSVTFRVDGFSLLFVLLVTRHRRARACSTPAGTSTATSRASAGWPRCSCCSPARCSAWSRADNLLPALHVLGADLDHVAPARSARTTRTPAARAAALQALLITGAGGLAMLGGLRAHRPGGRHLLAARAILADPPIGHRRRRSALVLVLLGALTKSAQVPVPRLAARAPWSRPPRSAPTCTRPPW